jgi:hypothetical protein
VIIDIGQAAVSLEALGLLTAGLDRRDGLHEQLYVDLVATHEGAAKIVIGIANVAELLCLELADHLGCSEEQVLQRLGLDLHSMATEEQYECDE